MGEDLASIEQLVEMGAAHNEALGGLARGDRLVAIGDDDVVSSARATAQAQQQVPQLGSSIRAGELLEYVELLGGDLGGLKGLHDGFPGGVTDDVDVTDEPSVRVESANRNRDGCGSGPRTEAVEGACPGPQRPTLSLPRLLYPVQPADDATTDELH